MINQHNPPPPAPPPAFSSVRRGRLSLGRRAGEAICIGDLIRVGVIRVNLVRSSVLLSITLPPGIALRHDGMDTLVAGNEPAVKVVSLVKGETILFDRVIHLSILSFKPGSSRVVLAIEAPSDVPIHREEIARSMGEGVFSLAREMRPTDVEGLPVPHTEVRS